MDPIVNTLLLFVTLYQHILYLPPSKIVVIFFIWPNLKYLSGNFSITYYIDIRISIETRINLTFHEYEKNKLSDPEITFNVCRWLKQSYFLNKFARLINTLFDIIKIKTQIFSLLHSITKIIKIYNFKVFLISI